MGSSSPGELLSLMVTWPQRGYQISDVVYVCVGCKAGKINPSNNNYQIYFVVCVWEYIWQEFNVQWIWTWESFVFFNYYSYA